MKSVGVHMVNKLVRASFVVAITVSFLLVIIDDSDSDSYEAHNIYIEDGKVAYEAFVFLKDDFGSKTLNINVKKSGFGYIYKYECDLNYLTHKNHILNFHCEDNSIDIDYYDEFSYLEWSNKYHTPNSMKRHSFHANLKTFPSIISDDVFCTEALNGCFSVYN